MPEGHYVGSSLMTAETAFRRLRIGALAPQMSVSTVTLLDVTVLTDTDNLKTEGFFNLFFLLI